MAKTKSKKQDKKPPIIGNLTDHNIVEKSRPLMLMKEVPFSLGELKVLDTYLSRINARDPEAITVRFKKEEYEDLMGIERMRPERLSKYVDSLMGKIISVPEKGARGGWKKYTLFQYSECFQDDNEQWWIDLSCTPMAKKLFFNIESVGYIRYQLSNVLPLTSKHSVLLYIYLLDNRFRSKWIIPLKELREKVFHCDSLFYAESYKDFRRDILERALNEINEKTDLTFEYTALRAGRKIGNIEFTLVKDEVQEPVLLDEEDEDEQLQFFSDIPMPESNDYLAVYIEMLPRDFTREQVEELYVLAKGHAPSDLLFLHDEREEWTRIYLYEKLRLMRSTKNVEKPYNWLKKAVQNNWE